MNKPIGVRYTLAELDARFLRFARIDVPPDQFVDGIMSPSGKRDQYTRVDTLAEAHGISFRCPKCLKSAHPHRVTCWFEGMVQDDANPGPGRWTPTGAGVADLTFIPGPKIKATSVKLTGGCAWHGHIVGGCATVLPG